MSVPGDGLRNAAHQEAVECIAAMRTEYDQVGVPFFRGVDNRGFWIALLDGRRYLYAVGAQRFRGLLDQSVRVLRLDVPNLFERRVVSAHFASDQKRRRFYYVDNAHFGLVW